MTNGPLINSPDISPELRAALLEKPRPQTPEPERKPPDPHKVPLPYGGHALMYTRENLAFIYRCSHGELGRLLRAKLAPLPIRVDGQILWFCDEVFNTQATVERTLNRWKKR